jgi:hypothetical protein
MLCHNQVGRSDAARASQAGRQSGRPQGPLFGREAPDQDRPKSANKPETSNAPFSEMTAPSLRANVSNFPMTSRHHKPSLCRVEVAGRTNRPRCDLIGYQPVMTRSLDPYAPVNLRIRRAGE